MQRSFRPSPRRLVWLIVALVMMFATVADTSAQSYPSQVSAGVAKVNTSKRQPGEDQYVPVDPGAGGGKPSKNGDGARLAKEVERKIKQRKLKRKIAKQLNGENKLESTDRSQAVVVPEAAAGTTSGIAQTSTTGLFLSMLAIGLLLALASGFKKRGT